MVASRGASGYRGADVGTSRSLPTGEITELIESGVDAREIVRRMVATGGWSEAGAVGFVSFLAHGPDASTRPVRVEAPVVMVTRRSVSPYLHAAVSQASSAPFPSLRPVVVSDQTSSPRLACFAAARFSVSRSLSVFCAGFFPSFLGFCEPFTLLPFLVAELDRSWWAWRRSLALRIGRGVP